jgi:hypothetical protein
MRWMKETSQRPFFPDCMIAKHKIHEAFREGYIHWNIYNLAMERVDRNMKGGCLPFLLNFLKST